MATVDDCIIITIKFIFVYCSISGAYINLKLCCSYLNKQARSFACVILASMQMVPVSYSLF